MLNTPNTCVFPRGGARIIDIHNTIKSWSDPAVAETNSILFHVGGNDLQKPLPSIVQEFNRLLTLTKSRFPMSYIAVSAPLVRRGVSSEKVALLSVKLHELCVD